MSSVKLNKFLKGKLEGVNPTRDVLNAQSFAAIREDLVALNANFLNLILISKCFQLTMFAVLGRVC
jgi:hypothetical protein